MATATFQEHVLKYHLNPAMAKEKSQLHVDPTWTTAQRDTWLNTIIDIAIAEGKRGPEGAIDKRLPFLIGNNKKYGEGEPTQTSTVRFVKRRDVPVTVYPVPDNELYQIVYKLAIMQAFDHFDNADPYKYDMKNPRRTSTVSLSAPA